MFLRADSEDSDQTGRMPRLIWVFAGRTGHFAGFVMQRLKYRTLHRNDPKFSDIRTGLGKQCRPRSECSKKSSLIKAYFVCQSVCSCWTHYSMVKPHSSNFRLIYRHFLGDVCGRMICLRHKDWLLLFSLWEILTFEPCDYTCTKIILFLDGANLFELPHDKTNKMMCTPSEDSGQPGHPPSLISLHCVLNR